MMCTAHSGTFCTITTTTLRYVCPISVVFVLWKQRLLSYVGEGGGGPGVKNVKYIYNFIKINNISKDAEMN
jgi:hypothetical protein